MVYCIVKHTSGSVARMTLVSLKYTQLQVIVTELFLLNTGVTVKVGT